jgi:hypothetical protein
VPISRTASSTSRWCDSDRCGYQTDLLVATRLITRACIAIFVCGIAGLIISSVAGNNNGVVLTIGGFIVLAAIVLMTVNTVTVHERIDAFDDAAAEQLESQVAQLVEQGADENDVRTLVREARRSRRR